MDSPPLWLTAFYFTLLPAPETIMTASKSTGLGGVGKQ